MVDDNFSNAEPPRKTGSSFLIWFLGIGAVCVVVCCGGAAIVGIRFGGAMKDFLGKMSTQDPVEIRKQTAEMLDITIPDKFKPMQGMNMVAFRMLMYQTEPTPEGSMGMLMLMEMPMQQANGQQQEQELRKSMQQQQANQGFTSTKTETREIEIRGEKIPFEFGEGTHSSGGKEQKIHMVSGVVHGKRGPVMIQFTLPDEQYDEDEVIQTLQSIK